MDEMENMAGSAPADENGRPTDRTMVFVFGPPRSGTSAVSHVLERLGVYFGEHDRFVDPVENPHNPLFFELRSANELNDRICRRMGADYAEFSMLPDEQAYTDRIYDEFRAEMVALVEAELGGRRFVGLKDPRFVFTLPLWHRAMTGLGYRCLGVVTERDTAATVKSNSLVNRGFTDAHNRRVVGLSRLLAAWQARLMPSILVDFDHALAEPATAAAALAAFVGVDGLDLDEAAAVLDPQHRNHPADARKEVARIPAGTDLIGKRASRYAALLEEMDSLGLRMLVSDILVGRTEALQAMTVAEDGLQVARDLAADIAAGYASLVAMRPLSAPLRPPTAFLYLPDANGDFSEDNVVSANASMQDDAHVAEFEVETRFLRGHLRFDPDVIPGIYRLESVSIDGRAVADIARRILASSDGGSFEDLLSTATEGNDPWWILSLAGEESPVDGGNPVTLRFRFRRRTAMSIAADAAIERLQRHDESLLAGLVEDFQGQLKRELDGNRAHLEAGLAAAVGGLEERIGARLQTSTDAARAQVEALDALRGELRNRLDLVSSRQAELSSQALQRLEGLGVLLEKVDALQVSNSARIAAFESRLDAVADIQAQLLEFAKRRSPGYWLGRLFGKKGGAGNAGQ